MINFCVTFFESLIGSLRILVRDLSRKTERRVFLKQGDQSNEWYTSQVTVNNPDKYQVIQFLCYFYHFIILNHVLVLFKMTAQWLQDVR